MSDPNFPAMLTLAALTYRGFQDMLPGEPHEVMVRRVLLDGLGTLPPVKDQWELRWGPVTGRLPIDAFDSTAMYVVRHVQQRHRYVVAVRGTNPVAFSDWLFGDLWVSKTMPWPYPGDGAVISMSTALGLASLQAMRWRPASTVGRVADAALSAAPVAGVLSKFAVTARAVASGLAEAQVAHLASLEEQVELMFSTWLARGSDRDRLLEEIQRAADRLHLEPSDLRPKSRAAADDHEGLDLLSFLKGEAEASEAALEVTVTGHSKGGALAPAVALWLTEALASKDPAECWDEGRRAQVVSYAFAGPTPGNAAFAARINQKIGARHHHLRNMNDLVTHVWQPDELQQLPALYGERTAPFAPLMRGILKTVEPLDYRQATAGVVTFTGKLDPKRKMPAELIFQHLDAYLEHLGLRGPKLNAVTFFI